MAGAAAAARRCTTVYRARSQRIVDRHSTRGARRAETVESTWSRVRGASPHLHNHCSMCCGFTNTHAVPPVLLCCIIIGCGSNYIAAVCAGHATRQVTFRRVLLHTAAARSRSSWCGGWTMVPEWCTPSAVGCATLLRKGQLNRHTRYRPATTARNIATLQLFTVELNFVRE